MGTDDTDPAVFDTLIAFSSAIGMVPIPVRKEKAGYVLNSLLVPFLTAYGIENLISSTSSRCLNTLEPYAAAAKIGIETHDSLTEEIGTSDPEGVVRLVGKIREGVLASGLPTAICVQRYRPQA